MESTFLTTSKFAFIRMSVFWSNYFAFINKALCKWTPQSASSCSQEILSVWKWSSCVTLLLKVNTIKCKNPNRPRALKSLYIATVITDNTLCSDRLSSLLLKDSTKQTQSYIADHKQQKESWTKLFNKSFVQNQVMGNSNHRKNTVFKYFNVSCIINIFHILSILFYCTFCFC